MKRVFVSFPFSSDPASNAKAAGAIARMICLAGDLPVAPHCYLPTFVNEKTERDLALRLCLELLALCDEIRVYSGPTEGMKLEIAEARRLGIPVIDGATGNPFCEKGTAR